MQQPPIVLECPECGEKYLIFRESYTPSENATLFSDGYFIDDLNWRTPKIIGCVTCELGFFPEKGKIIAEPGWDEFHEKWTHIKKAEPPTAGSLALELRARKNIDPIAELAIRLEFWYSGNHSETGRLLLAKNEKFRIFWNESLIRLEELLSPNLEDQLLVKAEINRQLKNFDQCISLLSENKHPLGQSIQLKAKDHISALFTFN